jgi:hypothetical protein
MCERDPSTLSQSLFSRRVNLGNCGLDYLYWCGLGPGKESHVDLLPSGKGTTRDGKLI